MTVHQDATDQPRTTRPARTASVAAAILAASVLPALAGPLIDLALAPGSITPGIVVLLSTALVAAAGGITLLLWRKGSNRPVGRGMVIAALILTLPSCFLGLMGSDFGDNMLVAQAVQTAARMHHVLQAINMYRSENSAYPPDLATLLAKGAGSYDLTPKDLILATSDTPPLATVPTTVTSARAALPGHCDFAYAGAGLPADADDADLIVLFPATDPHSPVYSANERFMGYAWTLGYADGHVADVPLADVPSAFARSNAIRARLGLGPVRPPGSGPSTTTPGARAAAR